MAVFKVIWMNQKNTIFPNLFGIHLGIIMDVSPFAQNELIVILGLQ
jgi:hypothetical protein